MAGGKLKRVISGLEDVLGLELDDLAVKGAKSARRAVKRTPKLEKAPPLAVKPKAAAPRRAAPKALPAPPKPLALPKPGPGLPDFAAKPKGGQWWAEGSPFALMNPATSAKENIYLGARFSSDPTDKALADWWDKALPRYIQNDFATPDDPLRALADQGYLQGVENAAQWSNRVKRDIVPMPLQDLLFGQKAAETGMRDETLAAMPWVNKMPATENIYGFWPREETIGALSHIRDEMVNALKPDASGIPADLAVRPESLGRMSFAQAAERVGQINQWRAKQAEQAQISALNNPAIHTFKEYAENNPMGLRWVELKAPAMEQLPEGYTVSSRTGPNGEFFQVLDPTGEDIVGTGWSAEEAIKDAIPTAQRGPLQQALRYEGDTMGHCVGGYCDDVLGGRSRIFSLRDAKGEPHVTIETSPAALTPDYVRSVAPDLAEAFKAQRGTGTSSIVDFVRANRPEIMKADDIIQIKGKQNRAPKDDYLPFVQDFVKSGQWGNVGDLNNTGLVKLPDGRYIQQGQWQEGMRNAVRERNPNWDEDWLAKQVAQNYATPGMIGSDWDQIAQHFEGFAIGGRVAADRCFCKHPMSVKRAA
jgi:hypothetical protein